MKIKNEFWETVIDVFGEISIGEVFEIEDPETSVETFLKIESFEIPLTKNKSQTYNCVNIRNGKLAYFHPTQRLYRCKNAVIDLRPGAELRE